MASKKYLDYSGLSYLWGKITTALSAKAPGTMVVNVTIESASLDFSSITWSADKTYAQISAHINAGGNVSVVINHESDIYSLVAFNDDFIVFASTRIDNGDPGVADPYIGQTVISFLAPEQGGGVDVMNIGWSNANTLVTDFASSSTPLMNGTAAVGSSTNYARADHVHPSDTTKANVSDILTKTNTTSYTPTANYHPATKQYVDSAVSGITDTNTTYTLSISGNTITLTPSSGQAQSINLPVYDGSVSSS